MAIKQILVLSEGFGSGHTKAAEAIRDGIKLYRPDWQSNVLEIGAGLRPKLIHLVTAIYLKTLRYSPKLWGLLYHLRKEKAVKRQFEYILHRTIYSHSIHLINNIKPDIIITTHPFPSAVISRLKRMGLNIPLHTVLTDFSAHGLWVSTGVDYYYVHSHAAKKHLIRLGVKSEQIFITGIPTSPKFWSKKDKQLIRNDLTLSSLPTILYMGGGLGIGISNDLLHVLAAYRNQIQLIVVAGQNQKLYSSLKENPLFNHPNISIHGYVSNVDELMDASDLLITKPGGVTAAEAIDKGLPMILLNPIPGQEKDNSKYIIKNNLGVSMADPQELITFLERFLKNPQAVLSKFNYYNKDFGKETIEQILLNI